MFDPYQTSIIVLKLSLKSFKILILFRTNCERSFTPFTIFINDSNCAKYNTFARFWTFWCNMGVLCISPIKKINILLALLSRFKVKKLMKINFNKNISEYERIKLNRHLCRVSTTSHNFT